MSIPVTEIPQARQDQLRAMIEAPVWGRLSEAVRDRVLRTMNGLGVSRAHLDEYVSLFNTSLTGTPSRFADLTEAEQGAVLDVATLRPGLGDVALLREIIDAMPSPPTWGQPVRSAIFEYLAWPAHVPQSLSPPDQTRLRGWRGGLHPMRLTALSAVLQHQEFGSRSEAEKLKIVTVMQATQPLGSLHFQELLEPATARWAPGTIASGTRPMFSESLVDHVTLLDALHRLATGTLNPGVTLHMQPGDAFLTSPPFAPEWARDAKKRRVLGSLVAEVTRPNEFFNQSNRDTCFPTTLLHRLARVCPAEYARLSHELLTSGRSRLHNGDAVTAPPDALRADSSNRSATERVTQASIADYWTAGPEGRSAHPPHYHNVNTAPDARTPDAYDPDPRSTWWPRVPTTASAVLGQPFERVSGHPVTRLRAHFEAHPEVPVFADVHWGEARDNERAPYHNLFHEIDVIGVDARGTADAVVYFWNPWGALPFEMFDSAPLRVASGSVEGTGHQVPTSHDGPSRVTVDDTRGYQAMPSLQFASLCRDLLMPRG
ncbi:MAG: hypothetical protein U0326_23340 [Polyangiales bacterium]